MNREIVVEGIFMNWWDRISGTVVSVDCGGSWVLLRLPRHHAKLVVEVDASACVWLDGRRAATAAIEPGRQLAAIGKYWGQVFRACSLRLYSSTNSPHNASGDSIRPPGICFRLLNTGEVAIREVGSPGVEILLGDRAEFDALTADPEQLRFLLDLARRGDMSPSAG